MTNIYLELCNSYLQFVNIQPIRNDSAVVMKGTKSFQILWTFFQRGLEYVIESKSNCAYLQIALYLLILCHFWTINCQSLLLSETVGY